MSPGEASADDPRWRWAAWAALGAFALVTFLARQHGVYIGGDDSDYALLARALRSFRYVDLYQVGTPPHVTYPPGFPAMLLVFGAVFGDSIRTLVILDVVLMTATLGLIGLLVARATDRRIGFLSIILAGSSPLFLQHARLLLSDAPMMFFAALAIYAATRKGRGWIIVTIVAAITCAMSRTAGVAAIAGIGAFWLFRKRWIPLLSLGAASIAIVGGWFYWTTLAGQDGGFTYASRFAVYEMTDLPVWQAVLSSTYEKVSTMIGSQLPEALGLPLTSATRVDNLAWIPFTVGASAVGLWTIGRALPPAGFYFLGYAAVLLTWPYFDNRLLLPIIPLLAFGMVVGVYRLASPAGPWAATGAALFLGSLLTLSGAWQAIPRLACDGAVYSETPSCKRPSEIGLAHAISFIDDELPEDAIIAARRGEVVYYLTGRLTVPIPWSSTVDALGVDSVFARFEATHILASAAYPEQVSSLRSVIDDACGRLGVRFAEPPHTFVLEVLPPGGSPAAGDCDLLRGAFGTGSSER